GLVGDRGRDGGGGDVVEIERLSAAGRVDGAEIVDRHHAVGKIGVDPNGVVGRGDAGAGGGDGGGVGGGVRGAGGVEGGGAGSGGRAPVVDGRVRAGGRRHQVPDDGGPGRRAEHAAGRKREALLAADHRRDQQARGQRLVVARLVGEFRVEVDDVE